MILVCLKLLLLKFLFRISLVDGLRGKNSFMIHRFTYVRKLDESIHS